MSAFVDIEILVFVCATRAGPLCDYSAVVVV